MLVFGRHGFGGIAGLVDVKVRQIAQQHIRVVLGGGRQLLAAQKFQRPVGAHMHDRVCLFVQPTIKGRVLVMRRQILVVIALLRILMHAAAWLQRDGDISEAYKRQPQLQVCWFGSGSRIFCFTDYLLYSVSSASGV